MQGSCWVLGLTAPAGNEGNRIKQRTEMAIQPHLLGGSVVRMFLQTWPQEAEDGPPATSLWVWAAPGRGQNLG